MKNTEPSTRRLKTGFNAFDDMLGGGLYIPSLNMICARPGMGKSTFAIQILHNFMNENGKEKAACVFALEMSADQIKRKLGLSKGTSDLGIIIDDTPGISVAQMERRTSRLENLGLIVIDYLDLVCFFEKKDRNKGFDYIYEGIRELSRKLQVPIVVTAQANRAADLRDNHRPLISDFTYTKGIEKYFDTISFLYREKYYHQNADDSAQIIVAKNCYGNTGTVNMRWDERQVKFISSE